ncbi:hypothetical protein N431DRAFT_337611 [Stipitochalara longipes BDJ]|nr:hypothetical protein N431DRAFT_337611 [Stipitochalara longipes BDJ]
MRQSFLSALVLGFSALARATISSPAANDQWPVGANQNIVWDTTGLMAPLDIHLVPAGATDITVVITDVVLQIGNTGTFQWAPPTAIDIEQVEIIIVDATKKLVISEVFTIIIIDTTKLLSSSTKKLTTSTKALTSTVTKLETLATVITTAKTLTQLVTTSTLKTVSLTKSSGYIMTFDLEYKLTTPCRLLSHSKSTPQASRQLCSPQASR